MQVNDKIKNNNKYENNKNEISIEQIKSLDSINNFFQDQFDELKKELQINTDTIHFVDAYYFRKLKNVLIELLKIFSEFIYFNSNNFNIYEYANRYLRRRIYVNLLNNRGFFTSDNE